MKICVLSDIHANIFALEAVLKDIKNEEIDSFVFLGDLIMIGPRPQEVYDLLCTFTPDIWIKGNTDGWLERIDDQFIASNESEELILRLHEYASRRITTNMAVSLKGKPYTQELSFNGHSLLFCHGTPKSYNQPILTTSSEVDLNAIIEDTSSRFIIAGHTHKLLNMFYKDRQFINFGSISMPCMDCSTHAHYGIIEIGDNGTINWMFRNIEFNLEALFKDMKALQYPGYEFVRDKYKRGPKEMSEVILF